MGILYVVLYLFTMPFELIGEFFYKDTEACRKGVALKEADAFKLGLVELIVAALSAMAFFAIIAVIFWTFGPVLDDEWATVLFFVLLIPSIFGIYVIQDKIAETFGNSHI